ncbi:hypothetical protein B0J18DRAFT_418863 [Chaetomium sp. MPI-SDFR-AT-0129]|nr:hypothetical protein B0J18DRAFT_418863 [Chaetomium sp. MPI-SDFR-AT-0129]
MLDGNRCLILGSGDPEVCHIVPSSLNFKEEQQRKFRWYLGPAIFCIFSETPKWVDGPPETSPDNNVPEGSDKGDEMKWTKMLRWRCTPPVTSRPPSCFQFFVAKSLRLGPGMISQGISPEALSSLVGKTFGDLDPTDDSNPVFALNKKASVSHLVETGDIFYIKVEVKYADRMLAALQIQWAAIKIVAMAGGVESLDDVGDHPEYLDQNLNWLGHRGITIPELIKEWDDYRIPER